MDAGAAFFLLGQVVKNRLKQLVLKDDGQILLIIEEVLQDFEVIIFV